MVRWKRISKTDCVAKRFPICGRIVTLADVYDALTTRRVYKPALTHDVARSIILNNRGKQFDPVVVDAFLARETEFMSILKQFGDDEEQPMLAPPDEETTQVATVGLLCS